MRFVFEGDLTPRDMRLIERCDFEHPILIRGLLSKEWCSEHLTTFELNHTNLKGEIFTQSSLCYFCFIWEGGLSKDEKGDPPYFYFFKSKDDKQKVAELLPPERIISVEPFRRLVGLQELWSIVRDRLTLFLPTVAILS